VKKAVLVGVAIAAAIVIGVVLVLSDSNNMDKTNPITTKNEITLNATGKHYSVNLTENMGVKTPP